MSEPLPSVYDAYRPPPLNAGAPPPAGRPLGFLKALAIIAIVLGAMGLMSSLTGMVALAFSGQLQSVFSPVGQPGVPQSLQDAQLAMQKDLQALQDRFLALNLTLAIGNLCIASLLLTGGILTLRLVPRGRQIFLVGCWIAIVFDLFRAAAQSIVQMQTMTLTTQHMVRMMEAAGGRTPPEAVNFALTISKVGMVIGVVIGLVWVVAKLVFYGTSIWQLRKPAVQSLFQTPPRS